MPKDRSRHPSDSVEKAIQYAEQMGWRVAKSKKGHAWGRIYCPQSSRSGCIISIWSTPRNADNHARHIRRMVDTCPHQRHLDEEESS